MVLSKKEVGVLIKEARKMKSIQVEKRYTQGMLAHDIGVSRSYVGDIETGRTYPNYVFLNKIAQACGVPLDYFSEAEKAIDANIAEQLAEYPTEVHETVRDAIHQHDIKFDILGDQKKNKITVYGYDFKKEHKNNEQNLKTAQEFLDLTSIFKIPVVGIIRAGEPILAQQNIIGYEYIPEELAKTGEYFGLKVTGDSMNLSRINNGDIVIVRQQPEVENGEVAVVLVDGENATIKKFYLNDSMVTLLPNSTNTEHQPRLIEQGKTEVNILGKVVKVIINL